MDEQDKPLALRIAENLEYDYFSGDEIEAAKELKRLHAENDELRKAKEHAEMTMQISCNHEAINELRRDAERYRWIARKTSAHGICHGWQFGFPTALTLPANALAMSDPEKSLGQCIDAAMKDK